ncbi:MAG: site-2 protease family protein [Solirubrobacterales bacterium]
MFGFDVMEMIIALPGIVIGLALHEYAHALVAYHLGDDTPRYQGRLTINPLRHLDPIGSLLLLLPPHFGWAKPVMVNPVNFRRTTTIRKGMMMVSLAGPAMNLLIAILGGIMFSVLRNQPLTENVQIALTILGPVVTINVGLALFNLIPVPPLDGSKILAGLLPERYASVVYKIEQYGFIILLVLVLSGGLRTLLAPIYGPLVTFLVNLPLA